MLNVGTKRKWLFSFTSQSLYCLGNRPRYSTNRRQLGMQGQSGYYYYGVLDKQHTALQKRCFHDSSTTQEHRQKKNQERAFKLKICKWRHNTITFNSFCICVWIWLCFSGYFMMQNSIGCVVSNEKWKNKSEFRVLKDVESDNHTSSVLMCILRNYKNFSHNIRTEES
jgi:hypothetical protein